ncbi:MAG: lysophospholipid acyltransferase family protein [Pseudomonadota bacterium]
MTDDIQPVRSEGAAPQDDGPAPHAASAPRRAPRRLNQGKRPQSFFAETAEWGAVLFGRLLLAPLGPLTRSRLVAWLAGRIGPRLWFARRIDENIDLVRPHYDAETRARIRRGVMATFARTAVEYMHLPALNARAAGFAVEGAEHLEAAKAAAGGRMVVVSAHYGNWEAVRAIAARHDAPLAIIYRAFNNRRIDDYAFGMITSCGWPAFRKGADGSRALLKHLRQDGAALILVDQRLGGAPYLDFMGAPAETSLAAAQLARKLKAPLLPACARREGDGFTVRFEPAIEPSDPVAMSEAVNKVIESWVDAAPEQWFWLHRRWRRRKKGATLRRTYGREVLEREGLEGEGLEGEGLEDDGFGAEETPLTGGATRRTEPLPQE